MSEKLTVFTTPPPTPNGPLHIGHVSGPYTAADIAARAARARGERALVCTGVDAHQNWVLARAQREGVPVEKMLAGFKTEILTTYQLGDIAVDGFVDPMEPEHFSAIDSLAGAVIARGGARMSEVDIKVCTGCRSTLHHAYVVGRCAWCDSPAAGGTCEGCGGYTSAQDLLDITCTRCGGSAETVPMTLPVLHLEDYRDLLVRYWVRANLPDRVRQLVSHYTEHGLPDVPIAYPSDFGATGSGPIDGMRVDVYVGLALIDFYAVARTVDPSATDLPAYLAAVDRIDELWHCHGIDNTFIYAVLWPALWSALGVSPARQTGELVNEFYTLDGKKFSTSRNHAIWANDLLSQEDPQIVRLFLAWDRPDHYETDFTMAAFTAFRDRVRPLLAGTATPRPMPASLLAAERERGLQALRPHRFDPAVAARCLLTLLEAGERDVEPLLSALTGRAG